MPKRPRLTDDSFLASVFHPKKSPTPTGIRKSSVKSTSGRNAARVRRYNQLDGKTQEILRRTGNRDSYLKGETTIAEARRVLRDNAIQRGIAKPVRGSPSPIRAADNIFRIANARPDRPGASKVNRNTILKNVRRMNSRQLHTVVSYTDYGDLIEDLQSEDFTATDGSNLLWYK